MWMLVIALVCGGQCTWTQTVIPSLKTEAECQQLANWFVDNKRVDTVAASYYPTKCVRY